MWYVLGRRQAKNFQMYCAQAARPCQPLQGLLDLNGFVSARAETNCSCFSSDRNSSAHPFRNPWLAEICAEITGLVAANKMLGVVSTRRG